ncbi:MAG: HAD family hydrolase [Oscillatoriales cyanobacterium SM2_2_1]|nr:HAD family hydrolase [Oscillatoriales cyanobacterium SM2_2_1]
MAKRLFTDFDGPILDVSERYYQVYQVCVQQVRLPQQPVDMLSKAMFWELKRSQVSEYDIAQKSGLIQPGQATEFSQLRREIVHSRPYFQYDRIHPWTIAALEQIQGAGIDLAVMTMRRISELEPVLDHYDLWRFFPDGRRFCLRDDYQKNGDTLDKPMLMRWAIASLPPVSHQWIVGDTEADIIAGKRYCVQTIGILSGIRNRQQLSLHQPEYILADLREAVDLVLRSPE